MNGIIRIVYYSIDEGEEERVGDKGSGFRVQGSGVGVSPSGVVPFDYVRKSSAGSVGSKGLVRRIKIRSAAEV